MLARSITITCSRTRAKYTASYRGWARKFSLCSRCQAKSRETELLKHLQTKLRFSGPITIAEYMREVLTNPVAGYYMHRDVFGSKGDFITSPEISQMFGELIGVWCVHEWMQYGSPSQLQLVELGPGRGTLTDDILRAFSQFKDLKNKVSVHLVEVSPKLSEMQAEKLEESPSASSTTPLPQQQQPQQPGASSPASTSNLDPNYHHHHYRSCQSKYGPVVHWYSQLRDVPREFSFYIAHEFFDALPIHKFQRQNDKWREVLVDLDDYPSGPHHLRFVLASTPTAASTLLQQVSDVDSETRDHIELCPEGGVLVSEISSRVATDGGFALIADYGHQGDKTDTFRAFKEHKLHDPLCEPGTADLTADVDFNYLARMANREVRTFGPVTQEAFLHNMGIGYRLKALLDKATTEQRKDLITGYDMLTNPAKMGSRFKFLALMPKTHQTENYQPAGFSALT